jgi:hypothetical protein
VHLVLCACSAAAARGTGFDALLADCAERRIPVVRLGGEAAPDAS